MANKPTVLVVGGTGSTGTSIVEGLIESGNFNVIISTRPSSSSSPKVTKLKALGASVRVASLEAPYEGLDEAVKGVDIVVSVVEAFHLDVQIPLIDAAKRAGVKRFIPCDFGTPGIKGLRPLFDQKLEIHDYIRKLNIPYTFIDVGFWFQISIPLLDKKYAFYEMEILVKASQEFYFENSHKSAITDLRDIGKFVAKILLDERTINQYVLCYGEQKSQKELFEMVESVSKKKIPIVNVSNEEVIKRLEVAKAVNPLGLDAIQSGYTVSIWLQGDNTIESAKKPEYGSALDARVLYPELKLRTVLDYVKEIYAEG